ncbi:hypothetical protein ACLMJK_000575 [Lecanora helva]
MASPDTASPPPSPSILNWILGFLLVGAAWGLTTPFIRRAAVDYHPRPHPSLDHASNPTSTSTYTGWLKHRILKAFFTVVDLLRSPAYAVPLVLNLTGSVWFFLLIGKAELSLTVPIVNSLAFLFTVGGEWWVEGRGVGRGEWLSRS